MLCEVHWYSQEVNCWMGSWYGDILLIIVVVIVVAVIGVYCVDAFFTQYVKMSIFRGFTFYVDDAIFLSSLCQEPFQQFVEWVLGDASELLILSFFIRNIKTLNKIVAGL